MSKVSLKSKTLSSKTSANQTKNENGNLDSGNKKQTTKKHVTSYFVNNYEEFINDGDFNTANEKVVASNTLGSEDFYRRSLNALLGSKPEKASALYRDMMVYYTETKEQENLKLFFSDVIAHTVFVEFLNLVTKKKNSLNESLNQDLFNFGYIHGLEFIMTVLEDDFVVASKSKTESLFNHIVETGTIDLHDIVTEIGEYFLKDAIGIEIVRSRKVLMKVFNLFFRMDFPNQYVAFPSLFSQFVKNTASGGMSGPQSLNSFLEGIGSDAKIKIINYVFVSRQIYKLTEKKDEKFNFTKLEDLVHLFNLLPKAKTNTNKDALEIFFILFYHIVLAIVSNARLTYLQVEKSKELVDDISMEVDHEVKIVQQLETLYNLFDTWDKDTETLFEEHRVYILSAKRHLGAVKKELQMK